MTDSMCDVSSPADWPSNWQELRTIDNLLRCTICSDFFNNTTQVPSCSHNYCALCIRRYLSYESKCPSCNGIVKENQLENNRIIDEIVKTFITLRNRLLEIVKQSVSSSDKVSANNTKKRNDNPSCSSKFFKNNEKLSPPSFSKSSQKRQRNISKSSTDQSSGNNSPVLHKKQKRHNVSGNTSFRTSDDDDISIIENPTPSQLSTSSKNTQRTTSTQDDAVGCPVCSRKVSPTMINSHLDSCLRNKDKKENLSSGTLQSTVSEQSQMMSAVGANSLIPQVQKRKPLNKLVYPLLSDKQLKQKLKEHGLSIKGDRQTLVKRHREFCHYYNSECSKPRPKSVLEIVRLVEEGERKKKKISNSEKLTFDRGQTQEAIDKMKENYISQNKDQFSQLIQNIKKRKSKTGKEESKNKPENKDSGEDTPQKKCSSLDKILNSDDESNSSADFEVPSKQFATPKRKKSSLLLGNSQRVTRSRTRKEKYVSTDDVRKSTVPDPPSPLLLDDITTEESDQLSSDSESMLPVFGPSSPSVNNIPGTPTLLDDGGNGSDEFDF